MAAVETGGELSIFDGKTLLLLIVITGVITIYLRMEEFWEKRLAHKIFKLYSKFCLFAYSDKMSPESERLLLTASRKTVLLNLSSLVKVVVVRSTEALCEDHGVPYDWVFDLPEYYAKVYVYKRPHLDFFIKKVHSLCHLTVFTSDRVWSPFVLDYLDGGQNVFNKRLDGSDHLSQSYNDLTGIILLAHTNQISDDNKDNTIPIDDYVIGAWDQKLLTLLPTIDALRFVKDVRSILKRYRR